MAVATVSTTIGTSKNFTTLQSWEDCLSTGSLVTAEKSACGTFAVAAFTLGESLTFVGSGATGRLLYTDSTGAGNGTYIVYEILTGNPAASDVVTGGASAATCILTSGTPDNTGVIWQGKCNNQEFSASSNLLTISGATTSSTCYIELTTDTGCSFQDNANVQTNPLIYDATKGAAIKTTGSYTDAIYVGSAYTRINKLQVSSAGNANTINAQGMSQDINQCILRGNGGSGGNNKALVQVGSSGCVIRNTLLYGTAAAEQLITTGYNAAAYYNCTIVIPSGLGTGSRAIKAVGSATHTMKNCAVYGFTSVFSGANSTRTTNYTDIASPPSGFTTAAFNTSTGSGFESTATDFRIKSTSAFVNNGTTDSTNAAVDIAGTARPSGASYDVGCWEYVSAGGSSDIAASGGAIAGGSAALSASYSLAAVAVAVAGGSAALSAAVPLAATGLAIASGSAGAVATVTIAATALAVASGAAGLSVTVTLAASGGAGAGGSATLSSSSGGSIAASGGAVAGGSALMSATVQISAAGLAQAMGAGALSVQIPLAAFGHAVAGGQATLSTGGLATVLGIGGAIRQQSSRPRGLNASRSNTQRSTR